MEPFLEDRKTPESKEKLHFGCLSWTYPDWLGSFYPADSKSGEFLQLYARIFDLVEIDSSFYHTPSIQTVRHWMEKTSNGFLFTAKLPQKITHQLRLSGVQSELERFERTVGELNQKLACIIAQLPPFSKYETDFEKLEKFLDMVNPKIRYAFEFRNKSWLRDETFELLSRKRVCFVWNVQEKMGEVIKPKLTTDFIYLRFMGKYGEFKKFNRVQKDRTEILETWLKHLSDNLNSVNLALILVSNHFSGFAPETVNELKELSGEKAINWSILSSLK